jgi:hypothetical protein
VYSLLSGKVENVDNVGTGGTRRRVEKDAQKMNEICTTITRTRGRIY